MHGQGVNSRSHCCLPVVVPHPPSGVLTCKRDEFPCRDGAGCVSRSVLCDGADNCGDGSDEASCQNCTGDSFQCGRTEICVARARLCDGQADCPDGQDEGGDQCPSAVLPTIPLCADSEFRCGDGQCVPHSWRCDHSPDCGDGSDEDNCGETTTARFEALPHFVLITRRGRQCPFVD